MKPFSEKMRNAIKQSEAIKTSNVEGFEILTEPSTRKHSKHSHSGAESNDEFAVVDDEEEEDDHEEQTSANQKQLTSLEVRDRIVSLWRAEKDLLDLMYGRYHPVKDGEPYATDSLGPSMFFIKTLIVPPNRFRPES